MAFGSLATNLVTEAGNTKTQIYVRDRVAGTTSRVSISTAGVWANGDCGAPSISDNGNLIAFESAASNLSSEDAETSKGHLCS